MQNQALRNMCILHCILSNCITYEKYFEFFTILIFNRKEEPKEEAHTKVDWKMKDRYLRNKSKRQIEGQ